MCAFVLPDVSFEPNWTYPRQERRQHVRPDAVADAASSSSLYAEPPDRAADRGLRLILDDPYDMEQGRQPAVMDTASLHDLVSLSQQRQSQAAAPQVGKNLSCIRQQHRLRLKGSACCRVDRRRHLGLGSLRRQTAYLLIGAHAGGGETVRAVTKPPDAVHVDSALQILPGGSVQAGGFDHRAGLLAGIVVERLGSPKRVVSVEHYPVDHVRSVLAVYDKPG